MIKIDWWDSVETIYIDVNQLSRIPPFPRTREYYREDPTREIQYETISEVKRKSNGGIGLTLKYKPERNRRIQQDVRWGTLTIHISRGASSGRAYWVDDDPDKWWNDQGRWKAVKLLKEKDRQSTTILSRRDQQKFKRAVLDRDGRCVISRERTEAALEAAHIIPAKAKGNENEHNGILLRADLHALFDAQKFHINPRGKVVSISRDLSKAYKKLLRNRDLPPATYARVKEALAERWKNRNRRGYVTP
jgi:hypothetical protein